MLLTHMVRSFKECIGPLFKAGLHITCVACTVNTVGSTMQVSFSLVDKFIICVNKAFLLLSEKRHLYKSHMKKNGVECTKPRPAPVKTR